MRGVLVYLMGASGAGKDSLLAALRPRLWGMPVAIARRYISRSICSGGERHIAASAGDIIHMDAEGRLAMHWVSHGCHYAIGRSMEQTLSCGVSVIVNGSREYLLEAAGIYLDLLPVLVDVPPDILRQRLRARGREQGAELEERIHRATLPLPETFRERALHIDNSGTLSRATDMLESIILECIVRS